MSSAAQDIQPRSADAPVPAAKMHVLGLAPIKKRLGDKWERLSALVHKLFEKAIANAQGPNDHFIVLDELSYVVTFGNLSLAQTNLMCASIAKEVCEHLFGDKVDEISVRNIVAEIVMPADMDAAQAGARIEGLLEQQGVETIVTRSVHGDPPVPVVTVSENRHTGAESVLEPIQAAHALFAQHGLKLGLFPMWELKKGISNSLYLAPFTGDGVTSLHSGSTCLSPLECCLSSSLSEYGSESH